MTKKTIESIDVDNVNKVREGAGLPPWGTSTGTQGQGSNSSGSSGTQGQGSGGGHKPPPKNTTTGIKHK